MWCVQNFCISGLVCAWEGQDSRTGQRDTRSSKLSISVVWCLTPSLSPAQNSCGITLGSPGTLSGLEPFQFLEPFSPGVLCSPGALGIPSALSALVPLHTAGMRLPCSNSGMCPEMSHRHHSPCLHSPSLLSQGLFPFLSVPFNPYPGTSICIISILPFPTPHLKDLPGSLGHTNSLGCKRTGCKTQLPPVHPSLCFPVSFAVSCGSQSTPELRHFPPGVDCSMCPLSGQES